MKPKSKGFQVNHGSAELDDTPQKEDVALFLHTSGTTSRPKVSIRSAPKHLLAYLLPCHHSNTHFKEHLDAKTHTIAQDDQSRDD